MDLIRHNWVGETFHQVAEVGKFKRNFSSEFCARKVFHRRCGQTHRTIPPRKTLQLRATTMLLHPLASLSPPREEKKRMKRRNNLLRQTNKNWTLFDVMENDTILIPSHYFRQVNHEKKDEFKSKAIEHEERTRILLFTQSNEWKSSTESSSGWRKEDKQWKLTFRT